MIIGFTGCKGSGKDTAAQFLVEKEEFRRVGFADVLKEAVANLFDMSVAEVDRLKEPTYGGEIILRDNVNQIKWTWREFLQRFGTEMGRKTFGQDFWVEMWEEYLYRESIIGDNIVVPDVRFPNEAEKIQRLYGYVVEITRPGYEPDGHESEEPLPRILIDGTINNSGSLSDFEVDVYDWYKTSSREGQNGVR